MASRHKPKKQIQLIRPAANRSKTGYGGKIQEDQCGTDAVDTGLWIFYWKGVLRQTLHGKISTTVLKQGATTGQKTSAQAIFKFF